MVASLLAATGEEQGEEDTIRLLEGQVEYLEGQVRVLREENEALMERLGRLGMKDGVAAVPQPGAEGPDFVGLGIELMKLRELKALPIASTLVSEAVIEEKILAWLRRSQPGDRGMRLGRAVHALGWIPEAVDPLPLRAALLTRQLGGWYDGVDGTLYLDEKGAGGGAGRDVFREALGVAWAQLLREFGDTLFPSGRAVPLSLDAQLARESLLGGDAGLTRFLYSLQNAAIQDPNELPPEDPDHPFNQVPMPQFFRQLHFFPFSEGFEFMQGLHSMGGFAQMNASYSRPPGSTAEVLDVERYLAEPAVPGVEVSWEVEEVLGVRPFWDDVLGQYAVMTALRAWNEEEKAGLGARGWVADRLRTYAGGSESGRGHAVWQTLWRDGDWSEAFFRAMRECLRQRYGVQVTMADSGAVDFEAQGRHVSLTRNRGGSGVVLIDAGTAAFAKGLKEAYQGGAP
jgi:hypothetical protein